MNFTKTKASVLLDLVRGLSALLVVLNHWRNLLFVDYTRIDAHRSLWAVPYLITSAGHAAVVIFFVLSGYLISGSVFRMIERGAWTWRAYLLHRLLRLWIVLIPGLLLGALWDGVGLHTHIAPRLYAGLSGDHMTPDVLPLHTVKIFFENLAFLQMIVGPTFGSNSPLWSLAFEFWYYILFPLGLFALHPKTPPRTRLLCGSGFILVAWFVGKSILLSFPIWLTGTLLALLPTLKLSNTTRAAVTLAYLPLFFLSSKFVIYSPLVQDYALTVATFVLLWVLLSATTPARNTLGERFSRELSRFSFTMYVTHMPLCVLLAALIAGDRRWVPDLPNILAGFCILAVLVAYAYGLARLTEFHTDSVRRRLESKLLS